MFALKCTNVFLLFLVFGGNRWVWWEWGHFAEIRHEHGIWTVPWDDSTGPLGACSESRFEPAWRNRGPFESRKSPVGLLVGWPRVDVSMVDKMCFFVLWYHNVVGSVDWLKLVVVLVSAQSVEGSASGCAVLFCSVLDDVCVLWFARQFGIVN